MFHIAVFMYANATLLHGGTNVVVARSDAEEMCRAIERERCTHAIVFPPTLAAMREVNSGGRFDLSSIWSSPDLSDRPTPTTMLTPRSAPWASAPGGYGQTEVGGLVTFRALAPDGQGTAGRAAPVAAVRIVDDADRDVPPGETGEIVVRGLVVMNGYHRRDELNALRSRGGWHHTGDLGVRWPDGSLSFVGPKVKMIKSAAENIYPAEVEACLARHEAVKEVCVIGVPDDRFSQSVRAVVVAITPVSESDLVEYCRTKIASYKKPRSVVFADSLPRDQNGLVDRDAVDAAFGGGGYPGSRG
jgi:long-chain acyl-CoA synthetase